MSYLYGHRQSCTGVTQVVSYVPPLHPFIPPEGGQDWQEAYKLWRYPFSTQIPDRAVSHTFVQPIDCLMPNPRLGDTNRVTRTSGWREGVTTPTLDLRGTCAWLLPGKWTCNLPPYTAGRLKINPCRHLCDRKQIFGRTGNPTFGTPPPRGTAYPPPSCSWWICTQATNHQHPLWWLWWCGGVVVWWCGVWCVVVVLCVCVVVVLWLLFVVLLLCCVVCVVWCVQCVYGLWCVQCV